MKELLLILGPNHMSSGNWTSLPYRAKISSLAFECLTSETGCRSRCTGLARLSSGVALGTFRLGADPSYEEAKIWFSGYYKCQKSPKKSPALHLPTVGLACSDEGAIAPLALPWRHPCLSYDSRWLLTAFHCNAEVSAKRASPVYRGHMIKPLLEIFIASATGAGYVFITDGCSSTVSVLLLLQVKQLKSAK